MTKLSEYVGWKLFDKVAIIAKEEAVDKERYKNTWYYGKYTIPQAYICDASDKKMIETGSNWAKWSEWSYEDNDGKRTFKEVIEHQPVITILDNKDFTLEVLDSANNSSQGGKLSFWNCKITNGNQSWAVGINSDYLLEIIKCNNFVNGVCQTPLFFARCKGGVGMLSSNMPSYEQALKDIERRNVMRKGKTSKRIEGHLYSTTTISDVYLGKVYSHYEPIYENRGRFVSDVLVGFKRREKPLCLYWHEPLYDYLKNPRTKRSDYKDNFYIYDNNTTTPARVDGGKVIELDMSVEEILDYNIDSVIDSVINSNTRSFYSTILVGLSTSIDNYVLPDKVVKLLNKLNLKVFD